MSIADVFHNAVNVAFTVFAPLVCAGHYIVAPVDSGWDDSPEPVEYPINAIVNGLTQRDLANTKFFAQIEPTDTVIMVKGSEITTPGIRVRNSDTVSIQHKSYTQLYSVVAHETDPVEALFLILLREK